MDTVILKLHSNFTQKCVDLLSIFKMLACNSEHFFLIFSTKNQLPGDGNSLIKGAKVSYSYTRSAFC